MRISNPFRYIFREAYQSNSCIFKMWFGQNYFLWKSKALHQSVNQFAVEIDRRLRLGCKPDDTVYPKIVTYIRRARVSLFEVEVVYESDNPAEILIQEHKLLLAAKKDEKCLNISFTPYIPKWIPESAEKEYTDWKTSLQRKKKEVKTKKKHATKNAKVVPARGSRGQNRSVQNRKR